MEKRVNCGSVLVIEDDQGIRETLRLALEVEGYLVYTATNGKEALELLSNVPSPCLILLDLMMPVMDGWAFSEALDRDNVLATIPVVVVTAFEEKATALKKKYEVVKKPVDIDRPMNTVAQYCGLPE